MKGYGQGWRAGFRQSKALTERQTRERSTNFTSPNMSCEVTASLGYLPFAPRRARRLDWVGLRPTPHPIRRRKAAVGGSLSVNCRPPTSRVDPLRSSAPEESCLVQRASSGTTGGRREPREAGSRASLVRVRSPRAFSVLMLRRFGGSSPQLAKVGLGRSGPRQGLSY